MPNYSIKLTPLQPNGTKLVTLKIKAPDRPSAQRVALKHMPSCRLHDDEPTFPAPNACPGRQG